MGNKMPTMQDEGFHRHIREASSTNLRTTRFCGSDSCKLAPGDTIYELLPDTRWDLGSLRE